MMWMLAWPYLGLAIPQHPSRTEACPLLWVGVTCRYADLPYVCTAAWWLQIHISSAAGRRVFVLMEDEEGQQQQMRSSRPPTPKSTSSALS
jgi:hypothetical protein